MSSVVAAHAALRARANDIEAAIIAPNRRYWQDEDNLLPDGPETFVFFEMVTDPGDYIEMGGGHGANRIRSTGELHGYVFFPRGTGLDAMLPIAEAVAMVYRSYRTADVSCGAASVHPIGEGTDLVPAGVNSAAGNYACLIVVVPFYFDITG